MESNGDGTAAFFIEPTEKKTTTEILIGNIGTMMFCRTRFNTLKNNSIPTRTRPYSRNYVLDERQVLCVCIAEIKPSRVTIQPHFLYLPRQLIRNKITLRPK